MNRIIPTLGASIILAANVLSPTEINFFSSDENVEQKNEVDLNTTKDKNVNVNGGDINPIINTDQMESGGRVIIINNDNDYFAPKYQRNYTPFIK